MFVFFGTLLIRLLERPAARHFSAGRDSVEPLDHPEIRQMSERQIADLPLEPSSMLR